MDGQEEAALTNERRRPQEKPPTDNVRYMSEKVKGFDSAFDVLRWVTRSVDWVMAVKVCYLSLYSHSDKDTRVAFPSIGLIAKEMNVTRKVAIASIKALEEAGAILVNRSHTPGTKKADVNRYTVFPPWDCQQRIERKRSWNYKTGQKVVPNGNHAISVVPNGNQPSSQWEPTLVPDGHCIMPTYQAQLSSPINTSSPLAQSVLKLPSGSPSSKSKTADPKDTQLLVARFDSLLSDSGCSKIGDWGAARKMAGNVLKGSGGTPLPVEQAIEALEWGFADSYQRSLLISGGLKVLRRVWASWLDKDNPATGRGWKKQRGAPSGDINHRDDLGY